MNTEFETVYNTHYEKLYTLAFRMTGNREDAEDVLQTAFLNAYNAFEKFRHDSDVGTWLYRIVVNASKKYAQKARRLPAEVYADDHHISQPEVYNFINQFGQTENQALVNLTRENCLQMFMNCMPPKYRAVYTLRSILHFSVKETAEILEISESAVKVNLNRARTIIKSHFDGRCSLIKPDSMCDCRTYAGYLVESQKTDVLLDIETMRNKERIATDEFRREMRDLLHIETLYNNCVKPVDYSAFLKKIKALKAEKQYKLLNYA